MDRLVLPIGIQDFPTIRSGSHYYVDKTPLIRRLVDEGRFYFLSRPRRFGKSLLLSTLKSLFEGREEAFRGLGIHDQWDWSMTYPMVHLSFDGKYDEPGGLEHNILTQLDVIERNAGLPRASYQTGPERLIDLLDRLHREAGRQVVVLVDEYDKPILDVLDDPDLASANRNYLRGFYGVIKGSAEHVRFVFVTGVSMFSKVSLFSGLNNLEDISLDPRYATICGYTEDDIDRVFGPELAGLDREEIRNWYNGYHWRGGERVYNPYDVLLLLRKREFQPYWFETGSPNFLFRMLMEKSVSPMQLENRMANMSLVSKFEVNDIGIEALLFQTGYLTIAEEQKEGFSTLFRLDYPNLEVQYSMNKQLLGYLDRSGRESADQGRALCALLRANDFDGFGERFRSFVSGIPYQWHVTGDLARYEAWYASLLHMCLRTAHADFRVEDASSHGRADMVVLTGGQVFVLEFKMAEGDTDAALDAAISQMRERGYAEKYLDRGEPIHLVGVACGREARNLVAVRSEPA